MKRIVKNVFMKPEDVEMIDKDINARPSYTIFSNQELGTSEVELAITLPEVFIIAEHVLDEILEGLIVTADNKEAETKKEHVKALLRKASGNV